MGNCLKTELKAVVNNDSLEYFGYLHINVKYDEEKPGNLFVISYDADSPDSVVKIIGDGSMTNSSWVPTGAKTYTVDKHEYDGTASSVKTSNGNYKLLIPAYNISVLRSDNISLDDASGFWEGLNYARLYNCSPNIKEIFLKDQQALLDMPTDIKIGIKNVKIVQKYSEQIDKLDGNELIQNIVETGRTETFKLTLSGYKDFYGAYTATRIIHIITAGTEYQAYNGANTELLYTAVKNGDTWTYTLNE